MDRVAVLLLLQRRIAVPKPFYVECCCWELSEGAAPKPDPTHLRKLRSCSGSKRR